MWQALGQIYLPTPKHILRPKFDMSTPNAVHQWDLFLPHDTLGCGRGRKPYKYGLIVLDVASSVKEAEPLTSKDSAEVASVFRKIYPRGPLKYPQLHSLAENWWALSRKKWKNTKQTFDVGAWRFTGISRSWKDSNAPLLSACSDTSMLLRCGCPRAKDLPNGSFGFLLWSLL